MNNYQPAAHQKENNIDVKTALFYLFVFLASSVIFAFVCYLFSAKNFFDFSVNGEPSFFLSSNTLCYITLIALCFLGLGSYLMWFSKYDANRPKKEIFENFISLAISLILFLLYPLFTFALALPIFGAIILGLVIVVSIYTTYRYFNSSIGSGIFITVWTLWLMYVFVLNFAYCLL